VDLHDLARDPRQSSLEVADLWRLLSRLLLEERDELLQCLLVAAPPGGDDQGAGAASSLPQDRRDAGRAPERPVTSTGSAREQPRRFLGAPPVGPAALWSRE
jgi:hypothetical protein